MKILMVHYNWGRGGGAESAIADLAAALQGLGHEVRVEYKDPIRAVVRWSPDIVHFHTIHVAPMNLGYLPWAREQGLRHCISFHDYWPLCRSRMLLKRGDQSCSAVTGVCDGDCDGTPATVEKEVVRGSPAIVFNEYSRAIFQRNGVDVAATIPYGVDKEKFAPAPSTGHGKSIVCVSAWPEYPTKGVHVLRAACDMLGERFELLTGISRDDVALRLREHDIFVFPSCYEETFGLSLSEAMASGLACVSSDVCGARAQIRHGYNGLLFPNRDVKALAHWLKYLLDRPFERLRMGAEARDSVLSLRQSAEKYVEFYKTL